MEKSKSVIRRKKRNQKAGINDYTAYKVSNPGIDIVIYSYKSDKQKRTKQSAYGHVLSPVPSEAGIDFNSVYISPVRFSLQQNSVDSFSNRVIIKFYIPVDTKIELILMNSDKVEEIYLINQEMKAGYYCFNTDINIEELLHFQYYYKLSAYGYSEVKEMIYIAGSEK